MFRRRFTDIVDRQLDLFEEEYADVIAEADEAEDRKSTRLNSSH